ncbi:MAG: biopolymer transporter ExbD [Gammaproteobacteria bacterium]|nr:biopolymer transporter ExbD [Pseudomonadales bacterium]MCP5346100.1 biopolymer transporter ExbD [Pseudomonadales bacterium]
MKFKRKIHEDLPINVTPLIDVVFLLLIFFMVTTTFTRETRLMVNLPEADAAPTESLPDQVEITVSRNGTYTIDGKPLVNSEIETLMRGLELATQNDRSIPILLIADAEATHQSVVTAMDGIGQLGFTRLSIATQRPNTSEEGSDTQ